MTDQEIVAIFVDAWRGVRSKSPRFGERYLADIRKANCANRRRSLISELLAEGLIAIGGSEAFKGVEASLLLWRDGEADGWKRLRDLVLLASAIGGKS